jgi:uncharacterized membrane protein
MYGDENIISQITFNVILLVSYIYPILYMNDIETITIIHYHTLFMMHQTK